MVNFRSLALGAAILSVTPQFTFALSASDIPADTPENQLIASANSNLSAGKAQDALIYFDLAIQRDPQNYLTLFKRGATYLSLGRNVQALHDFDKVLSLKPGFEGALMQRAKIKARNSDWSAARADYEAAGKKGGPEIAELDGAENAAKLATEAEKQGDWEACVSQAGAAILVAGSALDLRQRRARCRFEKGEVMEGISDLQHVLHMSSGLTEPHLQISAMAYFSLGETEKGLSQVAKCLQSDPDSKTCKKLRKREKAIDKILKKAKQLAEKRQFNSAVKLLVKNGEDVGLLQEVKEETEELKKQGLIHPKASDGLYQSLVEMACQAYMEMNNPKRARAYCDEALGFNPTNLYGLLLKAQDHVDKEEYEAAINTMNEANEHHPNNEKVHEKLNEARLLLKRSKQKDYYKVLSVPRDATEREIKKAWRKASMQFHPDKASQQGLTKDQAEKKMQGINEAYEVLSNPELRTRYDNGDDPNNPEQQGHPFHGSPFGGQQFVFRSGPGGGFPGGGQFKFQGGFPGF